MTTTDTELSDEEHDLLMVASKRWRYLGDLEAHVLDVFGLSLVRFHHRINLLIDDPRAEAAHPQLVRRLLRLRERRRMARSRSREVQR